MTHRKYSKIAFMDYLEHNELLAVLKLAQSESPRLHAMILLAYRHGMRTSEVCDLQFADIDLKAWTIRVRRGKDSHTNVQPLVTHPGEPLLDERRVLKAWLKERPATDRSSFVFTSQKGGRLDRSMFFRQFQAVAKAAGLESAKQHPHVLKHSLGSHLAQKNVNTSLIQARLGHRSISSTAIYVHLSDAHAAKVCDATLADLY